MGRRSLDFRQLIQTSRTSNLISKRKWVHEVWSKLPVSKSQRVNRTRLNLVSNSMPGGISSTKQRKCWRLETPGVTLPRKRSRWFRNNSLETGKCSRSLRSRQSAFFRNIEHKRTRIKWGFVTFDQLAQVSPRFLFNASPYIRKPTKFGLGGISI